MTGRLRALGIALALCAAALTGVLYDAARRRDDRASERSHQAVVDVVGVADLALSSSARWLRHPSQTEPGAATADLPSSLDVDPAGALIGPPHEVLRAGGAALE